MKILGVKNFGKKINSLMKKRVHTHDTFKAEDIEFHKAKQFFVKPDYTKPVPFGAYHTDHMMIIDYSSETGWERPVIKPYGPFLIDPRNSTLHYGIELFEGLKAYRNKEKVFLYRPELNAKRMLSSSERVCLPRFDINEWISCLEEYVRIEESWIHNEKGFSLYLRPTYISMTNKLGVHEPTEARMFFIACPVGPYFASGMKPISLVCNEPNYIRAAFGGFGQYKLGAYVKIIYSFNYLLF